MVFCDASIHDSWFKYEDCYMTGVQTSSISFTLAVVGQCAHVASCGWQGALGNINDRHDETPLISTSKNLEIHFWNDVQIWQCNMIDYLSAYIVGSYSGLCPWIWSGCKPPYEPMSIDSDREHHDESYKSRLENVEKNRHLLIGFQYGLLYRKTRTGIFPTGNDWWVITHWTL